MLYESVNVYILRCLSTNQSSIFKVVGSIHNYIYKKKHSKKSSVIKTIILTNNYIYELIKTFKNIDSIVLKSKMHELTQYSMTLSINTKQIQEKLSYTQRQYEGEQNELKMKLLLERVFVDSLTHTKYKYTHYDYYGNICLYELKSLSFMYSNVFLGTDKSICENLIIIYTFDNLPQRYFYIKYSSELFNTFKTTYTKPKNRLYMNEVYLIPKELLIEFNENDRIQINTIDENDIRKSLISKDLHDYNTKHNLI